jgi:hypothetical protein
MDTNRSSYRGVYETSWGGTWFASIQKSHKKFYLGTFADARSAARAYDQAALQLYGPDAVLNFPLSGEYHQDGEEQSSHHPDEPQGG